MEANHEHFIRQAIEMATENVRHGNGGPFGAVIVKDDQIIGKGVNCVTTCKDPTAHAEVSAIRDACRTLDDYKLEGAVIYTSCEPCPMCLSAIYWARIQAIYYAASQHDASRAGFDDSFIYREIPLPPEKRSIPIRHLDTGEASLPFRLWVESENKKAY